MQNVLTVRDAYFDDKNSIRTKKRTTDIVDLNKRELLMWDIVFVETALYSVAITLHIPTRYRYLYKKALSVGLIGKNGDRLQVIKNERKIRNTSYDGVIQVTMGPFDINKDIVQYFFIERKHRKKFSISSIKFESILDPTLPNIVRNSLNIGVNENAYITHISKTPAKGFYHEIQINEHIKHTYYNITIKNLSIGISMDCEKMIYITQKNTDNGSIVDKGALQKIMGINNGIRGQYPFNFKLGKKYPLFVRLEHISLMNNDYTYYIIFIKHSKKWHHLATIRIDGNHLINAVYSMIETTSPVNVNLYSRSIFIGNTWFLDDNKLTKCSTHLYKATNKKNSHIKFDRASELIIGGNLGMEYDTDELILTGYDDGNAPIVPLDYHNYIRMKKN
jgi:hypothetical protein